MPKPKVVKSESEPVLSSVPLKQIKPKAKSAPKEVKPKEAKTKVKKVPVSVQEPDDLVERIVEQVLEKLKNPVSS